MPKNMTPPSYHHRVSQHAIDFDRFGRWYWYAVFGIQHPNMDPDTRARIRTR